MTEAIKDQCISFFANNRLTKPIPVITAVPLVKASPSRIYIFKGLRSSCSSTSDDFIIFPK